MGAIKGDARSVDYSSYDCTGRLLFRVGLPSPFSAGGRA